MEIMDEMSNYFRNISYQDCIITAMPVSSLKCLKRYKLKAAKRKTLHLVWSLEVITIPVT